MLVLLPVYSLCVTPCHDVWRCDCPALRRSAFSRKWLHWTAQVGVRGCVKVREGGAECSAHPHLDSPGKVQGNMTTSLSDSLVSFSAKNYKFSLVS